ncbi:MAG: histidine kinase [Prevotellaceae bacterium]|jgi:sensor histidine kinase YesM|nr:histidine kinase [Prevotellaceae bacterium]
MNPFRPYSNRTAISLSLIISFLLNFIFLLGLLYARSNFPPPDDIRGLSEGMKQINAPYTSTLLSFITNFFLSYTLYMFNFKLLRLNVYKKGLRLFLIIFGTFILTLILSYILSKSRMMMLSLRDFHHPERFFWGNIAKDLFIAMIIIFSTQLIYLWDKQQKTQLENQKLMSENMRSRYEALKNQVDPHFLFNSLNTLNSLIGTDDDKAQEYVYRLSLVFRYTLQNKEIIQLEDEMEFGHSYLHLMKIRYGDTLRITSNVAEKYRTSYYIMPLSLQILFENAIKHNVISNKYPLTINIETTDNNTIRVFNTIQPKKDRDKGRGIGLTNLTERYKLLLQKDIVISNANGIFSVEIPLVSQLEKL